ncbi:uncharacterized protein LOC129171851 isoform X2 [Dunckerocampus dactyliophorus]|uniref:uncharacterized protein LOC129171851 isoform X2 n=1 Tax=Dunckerocampus dactyliophorus TaxID=161453 RepID=UPI002405CB0F|nr:uncharacterized protein LOC129171851 isoform X2 [Dunckerocampus dactyliophorus]
MFALRVCVLIFLLGFEDISGQPVFFSNAGGVVTLPCAQPSCLTLQWLYSRDASRTVLEVDRGQVVRTKPRGRRLNVTDNCSLVVGNVTGEDAGYYTCRTQRDINMFLTVMTLSFPEDADPSRDGHVTLTCTLSNYARQCPQKSLHWVDEEGFQLRPEGGAGHEFVQQLNCVSYIKVKRQHGHDRKYTCQYWEAGAVKIQAESTPAFAGRQPGAPPPDRTQLIIIIGAAVGTLMLLVILAVAVLAKTRQKRRATEDLPKHDESHVTYASVSYDLDMKSSAHKDVSDNDAASSSVTYAIVSHKKQKASSEKNQVRQEEEQVTYAAVRKTGHDGSK